MSEPCPDCKSQIKIVRSPMQTCPNCHHNFWNSDLDIEVDMGSQRDCTENPKSHKCPDWIEQAEDLEISQMMSEQKNKP